MGVIYKLKPVIKDFIIQQKQASPELSCRKLALLVDEKFQIKVSKSQVNSAIKAQGLSGPVGRRPKLKRRIVEGPGLGVFILKAADALIGGINSIAELIKKHLPDTVDSFSLAEALVYLPLAVDGIKPDSLGKLSGKQLPNKETILSYLDILQQVTTLNTNLLATLNSLLEEILFLKITFSDQSSFNVDGQLRTLWPSANIPYDFSITPYKIKPYINKLFKEDQPVVLFSAPGYDLFSSNWLEFLLRCNSPDKKITSISFMGTKGQELEKLTLSIPKSCNIIFGLWPWQYVNYRQLDSVAASLPFSCQYQKMDFILSDASITLSQHFTNQSVTLRGIALKKSQDAQPELFILTNIPTEKASAGQIANFYLNRWPGLQEAFRDFSRKIELFTYNTSARQAFPKDKIFNPNNIKGLRDSLKSYLEALDAYVRWYFLPPQYKQLDLSTTKERFYDLKAQVRKRRDFYNVNFILPPDYRYQKDLAYAAERINEREVFLPDSKRAWFNLK